VELAGASLARVAAEILAGQESKSRCSSRTRGPYGKIEDGLPRLARRAAQSKQEYGRIIDCGHEEARMVCHPLNQR